MPRKLSLKLSKVRGVEVVAADLYSIYAGSLRKHAHYLIAEGYARMNRNAFTEEEEPSITGELVSRMKEYLESSTAPFWVEHYAIADDPPLNVKDKSGKARPRVDIEFERAARGPRPKLRFEAKRLNAAHSHHTVATYLGKDGLGCFITGRYPTTHSDAGMLGYVQSDDENEWASLIETALTQNTEKYHIVGDPFRKQCIHKELRHTYLSRHSRQSDGASLSIYHVLLRFN